MGKEQSDKNAAVIESETGSQGQLNIRLSGRLDSESVGDLWLKATGLLARHKPSTLIIDTSEITYCDGSGIGLLFELRRRQKAAAAGFEIKNLKPEFQKLLDLFDPDDLLEEKEKAAGRPDFITEAGMATVSYWQDTKMFVSFIGELFIALAKAMLHPGKVRWKDALLTAETAGVNALPIICLVSFLIGLIIAFQSAIPLRQFGADIFVADLVAISMLRELGPLMTAIVLAGRSGSAFAAELGTMKVNEEIDALVTMGLDPVRFLAVTRVIATIFITPLLTVFANLLGIIGGAVVLMSLGFPLIAYVNQVIGAADYVDFLGGMAKALVFGLLVAGVGCMRGLQTGTGASAVGDSTTKAVVNGIVLIIITDGIFSVMFFYLGI